MNRLRLIIASPLFWGGLALAILLGALTPWVYPGEGAVLLARTLGVWQTAPDVTHPLVALFFGSLGKFLPTSAAIVTFNICSAVAGALSVALLCCLTKGYFLYVTEEPRSRPFVDRAIAWAVPLAGLTLLLSPDFLRSATHFQWQTFDLFLVLAACLLLLRTAESGSARRMVIAAFAWGMIAPEAPMTLALSPFFALALMLAYVFANEQFRLRPLLTCLLLPMAVGALLTVLAAGTLSLGLGYEHGLRGAMTLFVRQQVFGILEALQGSWILMGFFGVLPFVLALFTGRDIGANRRSPVVFVTYLTVAVLACVTVLPVSAAPSALAQKWTEAYPVLIAAMTAFAVAFVGGAGALLFSVRIPAEGIHEMAGVRRAGGVLACLTLIHLPLAVLVFGGWAVIRTTLADRAHADLPRRYADKILECAKNNNETWLLGDGVADPYLALRLAETRLPVTLFSLTQDNTEPGLNRLRKALEASPHFTANPELAKTLDRALDIGMIPFIQDWLRADNDSLKMFVTLSLPDLWYTGDRLPLPEQLWYRGVADRTALHAALRVEPYFPSTDLSAFWDAQAQSVRDFAAYVCRQAGFVANNTAFFLADAGRKEEAYELFLKIYAYDPDNVSALFNIFELVNGGLHPERKEWCERELNALIKRLSGRKYRLWALARTYGYIRSPQLISALAGNWAMSGQTGAALSGLDLAMEMLDDGQKTALQGAIAALYNVTPGKRGEAIRRYKELLGRSTDAHQSLVYLRELIRMSILEGDLAEAKKRLEQAESAGNATELAYERALYHASAGEPAKARIALQAYLDRHPKNLEATAMLATLQLQAGELEDLRAITLPKLISAAGTEDNYYVQIINAQLAERDNALVKARAAYLRALGLKPEVYALRTTVLALDIRLNDKAAAARHARQFLYQDRTLPLANYIMGALALGEGDLRRALGYLTLATAPEASPPIPEAFNDLAETHRRMGKWAAALAAAQRACELSPDLAVAHETAAAAMLELGRFSEASAALDKAMSIDARLRPGKPTDPRFLITRARLQQKEGHPELARVTLADARKQYETLDRGAKDEFDALAAEVGLRP